MNSLQVTYFQKGKMDQCPSGWINEKTVPYCIVAMASRGEYEISCGGKSVRPQSGEAFLTGPNKVLRIVHHQDRQDRFASSWLHFSCLLFHAIDLGSILEMPLMVNATVSREFSRIIDEFAADASTLEGALRNQELMWKTIRLVAGISQLQPGAEERIKAGERLEPLLIYLREHLDGSMTVGQMAELSHMSTPRFFAFFQQRMGCSPQIYLKRLRLDEAARQLASSDRLLKEVAAGTGFANPFHFGREFRKRFGLSPGKFRTLHRQQSAGVH